MLIENLVEGLRMFITSQASSNKITPTVILIVIGCFICIMLAEVFIGLSVYKMLHATYGYEESLALLITSSLYIIQAGLLLYYIAAYYEKLAKKNILIREYNSLKNIFNAFIEGYKSK